MTDNPYKSPRFDEAPVPERKDPRPWLSWFLLCVLVGGALAHFIYLMLPNLSVRLHVLLAVVGVVGGSLIGLKLDRMTDLEGRRRNFK